MSASEGGLPLPSQPCVSLWLGQSWCGRSVCLLSIGSNTRLHCKIPKDQKLHQTDDSSPTVTTVLAVKTGVPLKSKTNHFPGSASKRYTQFLGLFACFVWYSRQLSMSGATKLRQTNIYLVVQSRLQARYLWVLNAGVVLQPSSHAQGTYFCLLKVDILVQPPMMIWKV